MVAAFFFVVYSTTNHIHFFTPVELPMSAIDQWVPLVPASIWIYISEYTMFAVAFYLMKDIESINRYAYSFGLMMVICAIFFIFYPTTYPRHLYPLPSDILFINKLPFGIIRTLDDPSNSFPSSHVSACFVTALAFVNESKKKMAFFIIWSLLISVSTLTTKQHYLADVIAGFALAVFSHVFFFYGFKLRIPGEHTQQSGPDSLSPEEYSKVAASQR
jgi:membrane-associated phospholipid phosphatase